MPDRPALDLLIENVRVVRFEGLTLTGQVQATFLRGYRIYDAGEIQGPPRGGYLRRPSPAP